MHLAASTDFHPLFYNQSSGSFLRQVAPRQAQQKGIVTKEQLDISVLCRLGSDGEPQSRARLRSPLLTAPAQSPLSIGPECDLLRSSIPVGYVKDDVKDVLASHFTCSSLLAHFEPHPSAFAAYHNDLVATEDDFSPATNLHVASI